MLDAQRRIAELEAAPAVTHAHYIDGGTARRARTRRVVGKVAPEATLCVVGDEPATAATTSASAARMPTRRAGRKAAAALRVVPSDVGAATATTATTTGEPTVSPQLLGNG